MGTVYFTTEKKFQAHIKNWFDIAGEISFDVANNELRSKIRKWCERTAQGSVVILANVESYKHNIYGKDDLHFFLWFEDKQDIMRFKLEWAQQTRHENLPFHYVIYADDGETEDFKGTF